MTTPHLCAETGSRFFCRAYMQHEMDAFEYAEYTDFNNYILFLVAVALTTAIFYMVYIEMHNRVSRQRRGPQTTHGVVRATDPSGKPPNSSNASSSV